MMPLSLNETTSPLTVVPEASGNDSAPAAASSPQSQKPAIVQRILRTGAF
jgi:hypothetical protein